MRSLQGEVLFDGEVWHVYTIAGGLIARMDFAESGAGVGSGPSAAFAKR